MVLGLGGLQIVNDSSFFSCNGVLLKSTQPCIYIRYELIEMCIFIFRMCGMNAPRN